MAGELEQQLKNEKTVADAKERVQRMLAALDDASVWSSESPELEFGREILRTILSGTSEYHGYAGTEEINVSFIRQEAKKVSSIPVDPEDRYGTEREFLAHGFRTELPKEG